MVQQEQAYEQASEVQLRGEQTPGRPTGRQWYVVAAVALTAFAALVAAVVAVGGRDAFDLAVYHDALTIREPDLTGWAQALTWLGAAPVVVGLTAVAIPLLWLRTRQVILPLALAAAVTLTASTVYLLKIAVARPRPATGTLIGLPSTDMSFPSGHASDGSVLFLLLALLVAGSLRRHWLAVLLVVLGAVVALTIGATRIYLGYHWATDVLAGWCLATAVATGAMGLTRTAAAVTVRR